MDPIDRMNLEDPISQEEQDRIRSQPWYPAFLQYAAKQREQARVEAVYFQHRLRAAEQELRAFYEALTSESNLPNEAKRSSLGNKED